MSRRADETTERLVSEYNPLLPHVRANPYPYYAALRRASPVHKAPSLPFYTVTRYRDVLDVIHQPETFSSTALQMLLQGAQPVGPNSGALAGHRLVASAMMIASDPPDHTRLRSIVNRGFTPRRIGALEQRLRELCEGYLAPFLREGRMELVHGLSIPLPVTVIAELLGVEPERREQFKHWSDTFVLGLSGTVSGIGADDMRRGADAMAEYFERFVAERRARPKDDLISVLVAAEAGEALTVSEILSFILLLLIAGNETTTNLIGNGMQALLEHPDQLAAVAAQPALVPRFVEETLRYSSPIQSLPRRTLHDTTIAGQPVPKDSYVMAVFASANRDEEQFPDADRFDIRRETQGHVAFGHGIHFCLGASLARLEARIAFETILRRCQNLRLDQGEVQMIDSLILRGPRTLQIAFDPVAAAG